MEQIAAALGDAARWRLAELLAERPRPVGELAELTGLRPPQVTEHLQALAGAGPVTVCPHGQRRGYALEAEPLAALAGRLGELARATAAHEGERDAVARPRAAADGRVFTFERVLAASPEDVWQHWTDPWLLAAWWAPPSMKVTACDLEPREGGRVEIAYRDAEGEYRAEGRVRVAEKPGRLAFDLAVTWPASFTGHYDLELTPAPDGTRLWLGLRVTGTTVEAGPAVAGVETGWGQVLDQLTDVLNRGKGRPA
jgi:uncharacterized protein YndB with AHSA1/START domain/DNA-binding transcriptional ArsR family regulator